jgi:phosphate-selective porin OprO/OprP
MDEVSDFHPRIIVLAALLSSACLAADKPPLATTSDPDHLNLLPRAAATPTFLDERWAAEPAEFHLPSPERQAGPAASLAQRVAELEKELQKSREAEARANKAEAARPTARFTAQLQADSLHFAQDTANRITVGDLQDGAVFRRARIGWLGEYMLTEYRIEFDFALAGRPTFLDVWAGLKEVPFLGRIRVGHFFEPFSLERYTPNRFMTFMERSLIDQAFAPARNLGLLVLNHSEREDFTWAVGVFRTGSDLFGDDLGDNGEKSLTGRVTWLPWYDEPAEGRYLIHLGAAYSLRDADGDAVRFRAQPEIRSNNTDPPTAFFVDTLALPAHHFQLYGLEAAMVYGPFSVQGEYMHVPVDRIGGRDPAFYGAYLYASYFLTGEHRPYRREFGIFDRVMPFEEFFLVRTSRGVRAGLGAWELAARVSHLELNDAGVRGGRLTELTFGVNWYMNPYLRLTFNYAHALLDRAPGGNSNADMFGLRAGFEF